TIFRELRQESGEHGSVTGIGALDVDQELPLWKSGENFVQRWHQTDALPTERKRLSAVRRISEAHIESFQRLERMRPDRAATVCAKLQDCIVKYSEALICSALDVELHDVGT